MKTQIVGFIAVLLWMSCILVSCLEELENTDKIASSTFEPVIEFPLINSDFSMRDMLTEGNSKAKITEDNGLMVITYTDSISSLSAESFFLLPDQQSPILSINGSEITFPSPGASITITKNLTFNFNTLQGELLDSILFKAGQLAFAVNSNLPANIDLQLSLSSLKFSGTSFERDVSFNGPGSQNPSANLQGSVIDLTANGSTSNQVSFAIQAVITDTGQPMNNTHNLSCSLQLNQLQFRSMFGDLGSHAFPFSADSVDVDVFDNALAGNIQLASPTIQLDINNSFGLPIGFNIQDITALKEAAMTTLSGPAVNFPTNPYRLSCPSTVQAGQSILTQIAFTPTNSNIPQLVSLLPNYLSYAFGLRLNPAPATSKNFVMDDSRLDIGLHFELPLHGSISDLTISKQFDFDGLGIDDVESSFIKLKTVNELPVDAGIQVYFLDASGTVLDSLFTNRSVIKAADVDASGFTPESAELVNEVSITQEKIDRIEQAEILVLSAVLGTTNNGTVPVKFSVEDKLKINLGVNTRVEYKLN